MRRLKPEYVLECGSGVTTLVIIAALKENGEGKLISVDEEVFFGKTVEKIAKDILGDELPFEMHIAPAIKEANGARYESVPDHPYGLVFVDGPQTDGIDLDVFPLLEKNPQLPVLIDVRRDTVHALELLYPQARFSLWKNLGFVNL